MYRNKGKKEKVQYKKPGIWRRHSQQITRNVSSVPKSVWMIAGLLLMALIGISIAVIHLGQDLIKASDSQKHASDEDLSNILHQPQHNNIRAYPPNNDQDDTDTYYNDDTDTDTDTDTEQIIDRRNGNVMELKKSEVLEIWKEIKDEIDLPPKEIPIINNAPPVLPPPPRIIGNNGQNNNQQFLQNNDNYDAPQNEMENDIDLYEPQINEIEPQIKLDVYEQYHIEDGDVPKENYQKGDTSLKSVMDDYVVNKEEDQEEHQEKPVSMENIDQNEIEHIDPHQNQRIEYVEANDNSANEKINYFESSDDSDDNERDAQERINDNEDFRESLDLDSRTLQRAVYSNYFNLPTFFDIDPSDIESLVKYWKSDGKDHPNKLKTKFREIQDYDLKETIMFQDETHNGKIGFLYNMNSHLGHDWNMDYYYHYPYMIPLEAYDQKLISEEMFAGNRTYFINNEIGKPKSRYVPKYDIYEMFASKNMFYQRITSKQQNIDKYEKYMRDNVDQIEMIFPENDTLLFGLMEKFGEKLRNHIIAEMESDNHGGRFLRALKLIHEDSSSDDNDKNNNANNDGNGNNDDNNDNDNGNYNDRNDGNGGNNEWEEGRQRRMTGFDIFDMDSGGRDNGGIDINDLPDSVIEEIEKPRIYNFNGLTSDVEYKAQDRSTTQYWHNPPIDDDPMKQFMRGNEGLYEFDDSNHGTDDIMFENDKFWRLHDHCVRRKSTSIYPNWRVLYKSAPLTCDMILENLLAPISDCLFKHKFDCPMLIDHGYFRFVFKSEAPAKWLFGDNDNSDLDPMRMIPIVLKVMKTKFVDWPTDWLRHMRETIFLQQLGQWEAEFLQHFEPQFQSHGQDRAFYFVPELGHCLFPTYITVTPFYEKTLRHWVEKGFSASLSLKEITKKSLEILSGVQLMHNIEGGPYMHTDIQPRQFMMDDEDNILINDFNRGKFSEYYFKNTFENPNDGTDVIIPCTYCMPWSHGHWRAPEELYSDPINEKLDVWSACLTVWNMFSYEKPFASISHNYEAIKYLLREYQMKVKLPDNVPPFLKDLLRQCFRTNMYERPDINELVRSMRYFYKNINRLSDGKEYWTLARLRETQAYKETNYPNIKELKEEI